MTNVNWIRRGRVLWVVLALNSVVAFGLTLFVTAQFLQHPSARLAAGLQEARLAPEAYAVFMIGGITLVYLVYLIVAAVIFVRLPHDGFALFAAIFLLNYGAANAYPQSVEFIYFYNHPPLWYGIPEIICSLFSWPLLVAFLIIYPDGQFVPPWSRLAAAASAVVTVIWILFPTLFTEGLTPISLVGGIVVITILAATLYAQVWRYRHHATILQKQQTKWFLYALTIFFVSSALGIFPPLFLSGTLTPGQTVLMDLLTTLTIVILVVLPIAVGIAILRYRLWDIDVLIRRTVIYSLLTVTLLVIYFVSIVVLQQLFSELTGQANDEVVTVLSTLGIAALFVPLRNRIQALINRHFNRNQYDAQKVLSHFALTVRDETDLEKLSGELMGVVSETMQPKSVSVWLRRETTK